ncbi:MAG: putative ABC exporter domain-containing protein [Clostridiaceae bacterium]|nr:putative ABC exporter domain-containing protein [Clostridiaceae bacterium]
MDALFYQFRRRTINSLKELVHKPARLIVTVLVVLMLGLTVFSTFMGQQKPHEYGDIHEVYAMMLALYAMIMVIGMMAGLNNGASFYSMADVNLLFCAPISPKRILTYGLVSQLGTTAMMAFFLVFQYGWLANAYNAGIFDLLSIIVGYMLVVFTSQLAAMGIYSFSSGNDRRKTTIRFIIYGVSALIVISVLLPVLSAEDKLAALVAGANQPVYRLIPIAGWLQAFAVGLMNGDIGLIFYGFGLTVLLAGLLILLMTKLNSDYYEDVIVAAETTFTALNARKEGKVAESAPHQVRKGKLGIGRGTGASVFFYKHLLENRRSKVFILDAVSIIFLLVTWLFAFFLRKEGILPAFFFSVYIMLFESFMGRWAKELLHPYIYLVPANPFRKLVMICAEHILKSTILSILTMIPIGLIVQADPLDIATCIIARIAISLLFIAASLLTDYLFGGMPGKTIQLFIYILVLAITAAPGAVISIIAATVLSSQVAGLLIFSLWTTAISAGITLICRNMLNRPEAS